ncbi:hypothetical protein K502DRAFT_128719 [Neoconidiobolus thromboides FSU 785]|nr:hypothetical protein K502DRAFT_128719 [Neoconidiobolus thromboides FSU 785]
MSDSDYHPELKKLRSYWQFANVCQFFLLFGSAYGMDEFHTDTFEAELIRQDKEVIGRYMVKLCSNLSSGRGARMDTWENILKKELLKNNDELPINKEIESGFFDLTLFQQIVCIQFLCDLQFRDAFEKLREAAGGKDAYEELRVEPIGEDKKGNVYYLFDDNRLYVQTLAAPPPKKSNTKAIRKLSERKRLALEQGDSIDDTWSPMCITLSDWEEFPKQFETSRSVIEKELYKYLMEDVIPQVSSELKAKLKVIKKKETLATMVPKRSSRLQEKEKQKKELEDKLKQEKMIKAIDKDVNLDIVKVK